MRTADDLVRVEVHYCVSSLVSTLASGNGIGSDMAGTDLAALTEQAAELCYPLDDWEEAARADGWLSIGGDLVRHKEHGMYDMSGAADWHDLCEEFDIEPYPREVFEHWIVSNWLASKLTALGEKVDTDFAGLTIWARTTTGQGIAQDWVIEKIAADLNREG